MNETNVFNTLGIGQDSLGPTSIRKFSIKQPATIMLFAHEEYEPGGGFNDYLTNFNTSTKLRKFAENLCKFYPVGDHILYKHFGTDEYNNIKAVIDNLYHFNMCVVYKKSVENTRVIRVSKDGVFKFRKTSDYVGHLDLLEEDIYNNLIGAIDFDKLGDMGLLKVQQ